MSTNLSTNKTLSNILSIAGSDVISRGFFFLFSIVVARQLDPYAFGIYSLAITIGIWLWSVVDAGLAGHGIRLLAQTDNPSSVVGRVIGTRLLSLVATGSVYCLFLFLIPMESNEMLAYMMALLFVAGMSVFPAWIARAHHSNLEYAISYVIVAFTGCILLLLFYIGWIPQNEVGAVASRNFAWLVGSLIATLVLSKRLNISTQLAIDWSILKKAAPLGGAAIVYTLIPLIPFISIRLSGLNEALGSYAALWQVQLVLIAGASVLSMVLLPSYSRALVKFNDDGRKMLVQRHFLLVTGVTTLTCIIYWLYGPTILNMLYGNKYLNLGVLAPPFCLALFFVYYRVSIDAILTAQGRYWLMLKNGIVVLMVALVAAKLIDSPVALAWMYTALEMILLGLNGAAALFQNWRR